MEPRWLYQQWAAPPRGALEAPPETITLDKWQPAAGLPRWRRFAGPAGPMFFAPPPGALSPPPEAITPDKWFQPASLAPWLPRRVPPGGEIAAPLVPVAPPSIPNLDTWFRQQPDPLCPPRRAQAGFVVEPLVPTLFAGGGPNLDAWFRQQPAPWPRRQLPPAGFVVEPIQYLTHRPAARVRNVLYQVLLRAHETIAGRGYSSVVTSNAFNRRLTLGPFTTPPVTSASYSRHTIGGTNSVTLDLTALPGTQHPIDAGGLLSRFLLIANRSATGNLTLAAAESNAFEPLGAGHEPMLPPGAVLLLYTPEGLSIDSSHSNLKLAGTAGDTADVAIVAG